MTAATIRASATYRARRKAELARYREALAIAADELADAARSFTFVEGDHRWAHDAYVKADLASECVRAALQGDK